MPGALDGIRVLDCTEIIAGPVSAMLLADMGAEVIKIEPPWGEPYRFMAGPITPTESHGYLGLNRGKKSLPLDLNKPQAKEIFYKLVPTADIVIVNFRPDVPYKLGIDYETLSAINPRLVYLENTAYGRRGPDSARPGYDIIIQGLSGLMAGNGKIQNGLPQTINPALADASTAIAMAWGACAGLFVRERTGKGQKIETSLLATSLNLQTVPLVQVEQRDREARQQLLEEINVLRQGGAPFTEVFARHEVARARPPGNIYYRAFQTKDSVITVACLSDSLRRKMAGALGLHDILFEPGYDPQSERAIKSGAELIAQAEALFLERTTEEWIALLDKAGVPCGPVLFIEELVEHPQAQANDYVVEVQHSTLGPVKMFGPVLHMSETPLKAQSASPPLGEHTGEILRSLGYSDADIATFREQRVTY